MELNVGRKKAESVSFGAAARVRHAGTLACKSLSCGDKKINRNGLNEDVGVSQQEARAKGPSSVIINTVSV